MHLIYDVCGSIPVQVRGNRFYIITLIDIFLGLDEYDGYSMAYKPITLSCILLMFIEIKFIHCHSCVMFAMKSMSMCND